MKKKVIIFVLSLLVVLLAFFLYHAFKTETIPTAITVKNGTQYSLEAIGIYGDNKLIFSKTEGNVFEFPKQIVGDMNSLLVVAVDKTGKHFLSGQIDLESNKEVTIIDIKEDALLLNVTSSNKVQLLNIPALDEWKISDKGKLISGEFRAKTDWDYTLYVLGKGGMLGMSDTRTNNDLVKASWEKPNKIESWILFSNVKK